jgi:hypothetical protein
VKIKVNFIGKIILGMTDLVLARIYKAGLGPISRGSKDKNDSLIGGHMEEIRCKKCGRPLRDPESIARGMGPECAGITGGRQKGHRFSRDVPRGTAYLLTAGTTTSPTLFTLIQKEEQPEEEVMPVKQEAPNRRLSDLLRQFPTDLVDLVITAPDAGAIAFHTKTYSRRKTRQPGSIHPGKALKEIRRMCIELRLPFWPGISDNGRPVACVPCGDDDWKFENSERLVSRAELEAYLSRYGMIGPVH